MWRRSDRKIFEIVPPDNSARVFKTNPGSRHPRITIGIDKINLSAEENVAVIGAARDQDQRANKNNFRQERQPPLHAPLKSAIRIWQFEIRRILAANVLVSTTFRTVEKTDSYVFFAQTILSLFTGLATAL